METAPTLKPKAPSVLKTVIGEAAKPAPEIIVVGDLARNAEQVAIANGTHTPAHYDKPVTPWMLQEHMESSGNAFVDARRADAIEYAFRIKDDLKGDLIKAKHCLEAAIAQL